MSMPFGSYIAHVDAGWLKRCAHWPRTCLRRDFSSLVGKQAEEEANADGVCLVDIWRVAPQSKFNPRLMLELYARGIIPEEEFMTHTLDARDPNHKAILVRQKCFRFGPGHNMFPEPFCHRYFDFKYKVKKFHWEASQLQNDVLGTELYLEYLQRAGLI